MRELLLKQALYPDREKVGKKGNRTVGKTLESCLKQNARRRQNPKGEGGGSATAPRIHMRVLTQGSQDDKLKLKYRCELLGCRPKDLRKLDSLLGSLLLLERSPLMLCLYCYSFLHTRLPVRAFFHVADSCFVQATMNSR